jgi:hypothetical protein
MVQARGHGASTYDPNNVSGDAFNLDNMSPAPGTTGKLLFMATNEADALDKLGTTTVGVDVLTATDAAAARSVLEIVPGLPSGYLYGLRSPMTRLRMSPTKSR